ncbi:MAG: hypothetical protein PVS2B2_02250 [Candidatus Acidiferrum sp.]
MFSTLVESCNQSSLPKTLPVPSVPAPALSTKPLKDVYSVEELLANPQKFAHTMVTVSGCFELNFEMTVLRPCKPLAEIQIWIEDAKIFSLLPRSEPDLIPKFGLLFAYDEARNSQAWQKLPSGYGIVGSEVVLLGQFETSANGFGHLGAYPNELILVDVLSNKPTTTRPKSR